jgi:hypothetical protein
MFSGIGSPSPALRRDGVWKGAVLGAENQSEVGRGAASTPGTHSFRAISTPRRVPHYILQEV